MATVRRSRLLTGQCPDCFVALLPDTGECPVCGEAQEEFVMVYTTDRPVRSQSEQRSPGSVRPQI